MSIRAEHLRKEDVLEIINAIRHLPKEYLRNPNPYHCCPECQTEFEDSIGDNETYPSELDLVFEYIKIKVPND